MKHIARSLGAVLLFTLLLGFGYTLVTTVVAQLLWPDKARGSLVEVEGEVVGSSLLAQPFELPEYFWPRPSASGYNAHPELDPTSRSLSYPSNLGPTNPDLVAAIEERVAVHGVGVPVDLVTGSGSSLDPHISSAAAKWQAARVAAARDMEVDQVLLLIDDLDQSWLGRRYVNVLQLNLALDQLTGPP
jgi:K+-transporting ATPase ATPase C chain